MTWNADSLFLFIHVRDDYQSYAITPQECVAHWLADSVEILIDPRGTASQVLKDTASTFKLGVFPFTNDPANFNGNGVNGPCWERDADNHQGFATGPLAATVDSAPNAPGVQVASTANWVGSNQTTTDHSYAGGFYNLEVKIPLADLPAAVDPAHMGFNITPYDEDNTAAAGTTTLLHQDQSTRLAWSTFGSVQSDPYRWGHATMAGYTPPAGRPTTPAAPNVSHPNLDGAASPQTIYQSARNGVPISSRRPAADGIAISNTSLSPSAAEFDVDAAGPGTAHVFLWAGDHAAIPVFLTSCALSADPPPDYGLTACATADGASPPWSPDMSGRVIRDVSVAVAAGHRHVTIPLDAASYAKLAATGSALVSFETPADQVQALDIPLAKVRLRFTAAPSTVGVDVIGTDPFPGTPTGTIQFKVDGVDAGAPVALDNAGHAQIAASAVGHTITAVYSGDGDYASNLASLAGSDVSGTVPSTLSLTLGPPASFGAFTPGVARDYTAATTANVTSTAGEAVLSVTDPGTTAPGHLVNGAFSLAQAVQARALNAMNTSTAFNAVSGSPLGLLSYPGPISNDAVTLQFKQSIGANEPLRTGSYSKALTFTLSTTTP